MLQRLPEWLVVFGFYGANFFVWLVLEYNTGTASFIITVLTWSQRFWLSLLAWYGMMSYREWCLMFKTRHKRSQPRSPSNKRRPSAGVRQRKNLGLPTLINSSSQEQLHCPFSAKKGAECPFSEKREDGSATRGVDVPSLGPRERRRGSACGELPGRQKAALDTSLADTLDMDHVHLDFWDFMWGRIVIGIPLYANMLFGGPNTLGVLRYTAAWLLQRCGLWRRKIKDPRKICYELLLHTSVAMYVQGVVVQDDGKKVAHFLVPDAPHYINDGKSLVFMDFKAAVDLQEKVLMRASFGSRDLQADEALITLNMIALFMGHPLLHAYTNWAVNPESPNAETRRCSIVTVLYNNYGKTGFGYLLDLLKGLGIGRVGSSNYGGLISTISQHPPQHAHVRCLMPHSDFVAYVIKARNYFLNEFTKHQADFPGIDGEALFLTCVFHAIDHFSFCRLQSALDLVCSNSEYDAEVVMVRAALVSTADKLWLAPYFYDFTCKGSRHPLFRNLYLFCRRLNPALAEEMECCVMR